MNMIERVARASFTCWRKRMDELGHHLDRNRAFEDMTKQEHAFALDNARAVIKAMREPTAAMLHSTDLIEGSPLYSIIEQIWYAMIDEALK